MWTLTLFIAVTISIVLNALLIFIIWQLYNLFLPNKLELQVRYMNEFFSLDTSYLNSENNQEIISFYDQLFTNFPGFYESFIRYCQIKNIQTYEVITDTSLITTAMFVSYFISNKNRSWYYKDTQNACIYLGMYKDSERSFAIPIPTRVLNRLFVDISETLTDKGIVEVCDMPSVIKTLNTTELATRIILSGSIKAGDIANF